MADNFSMPLEIAVRTSTYLTKLLIQHGAPLRHYRKDCKSVIHHAIHPYSNMRPVYLSHCFVDEVVKILLESGADVNDRYHNINLMEIFFKRVKALFEKFVINNDMNNDDDYNYLHAFWRSLLKAAKLVVKAGLKISTSHLMLTYQYTLEYNATQYMHRFQGFAHTSHELNEKFEKFLALSFQFVSEVLYVFIGTVRETDVIHRSADQSNIMNTTLEMVNRIFCFNNENSPSRWAKSSIFCESLHNVLRKQYLNIPSQIIPLDSLKTYLTNLGSNYENNVIAIDALKELIAASVPLKDLHELQSIQWNGMQLHDLISCRMSLRFLTKLTIIDSLPYPKENATEYLPIPETLKQYLSFRIS